MSRRFTMSQSKLVTDKLTNIETIAQNASYYSRKFILKGSTQLENNYFDELQRKSLSNGISDLRELCKEFPTYAWAIDQEVARFYQTIKTCKKLSIGNCHELALMALDYVVRFAPQHVNAEVYRIDKGDHVFLVIGRAAESHPNKPETWGNGAFICDPWSNKVYPASNYLTQTKNFYRTWNDQDYVNNIQDFDVGKHRLKPIKYQNTQYLRQAKYPEHLDRIIVSIQARLETLVQAMETLKDRLVGIMNELKNKYPNNDEKKLIIEQMVIKLQVAIEDSKKNIKKAMPNLEHELKQSALQYSLKETVSSYKKSIQVKAEDKDILGKYNNENSLITKFLRFFKIPPKTARDAGNALDKTTKIFKDTLSH